MRPTTSAFLKASYWTYQQTARPNPFLLNGKPMTALNVGAGFFAAASVTATGEVIVAFEGTDIGGFSDNPDFVVNQIAADFLIYRGEKPTAYGLALSFTQSVIAAAGAQGIGRDKIYVTGHSLGGAEAAYVAAQLDLPGETYGAPGISASFIPPLAGSQLVNYVEHGDPVGKLQPRHVRGAQPALQPRHRSLRSCVVSGLLLEQPPAPHGQWPPWTRHDGGRPRTWPMAYCCNRPTTITSSPITRNRSA